MIQPEVLLEVLEALEVLGVPYMLVGSFASNYWGRPRMTHDADLLLELNPEQAIGLAQRLGATFYAPGFALREAALTQGHANLIHLEEAFKVDLWMRRDDPYDRVRFARRQAVRAFGRRIWLSSAEDVILAKLRWRRQAGAERQFQDALEVYEIQQPGLDEAYVDHWAAELGLADLLARVRGEAALPEEQGE